MKVIDLLNKIANEEQVSKMIIYRGEKYCITNDNFTYWKFGSTMSDTLNIDTSDLNDEVEIIEEPQEHKIPEKLNKKDFLDNETIEQVDADLDFIIDKINEIIDYLEEENGN